MLRAPLWAALLVACQAPPRLDTIEPAAVRPGARLRLSGADLQQADAVVLRGADGSVASAPLEEVGPASASVTAPLTLASGLWRVQLRSTAWRAAQGSATFEVWRPETEVPCHRRYALKVTTERLRRQVVVEHNFEDGSAEQYIIEGAQLAGIDVRTAGSDGCVAVWLRTTDGPRWLLADGVGEAPLLQAKTLADALTLPLSRE